MKKALFLIFCTTVSFSSFAGWKYTDWGMSEQQVIDAGKKDNVEVVPSQVKGEKGKTTPLGENTYRLIGDMRFVTYFYFKSKKDGLTSVVHVPIGEQPKCLQKIEGFFSGALGKGRTVSSDRTGPDETVVIWVDEKEGHAIFLSHSKSRNSCVLSFEKLD